MSIALNMLIYFVYYLIGGIQLAMMVRAILSWIMPDAEGVLIDFLYAVTEPFIGIVRRILDKLSFNPDFPLDIAFMITVILLEIIRLLLSTFI